MKKRKTTFSHYDVMEKGRGGRWAKTTTTDELPTDRNLGIKFRPRFIRHTRRAAR